MLNASLYDIYNDRISKETWLDKRRGLLFYINVAILLHLGLLEKIPKRNCNKIGYLDGKQVDEAKEVAVVSLSNATADPGAMMV